MLDIIICEDNEVQRSMVENYLKEIISVKDYDAQIYISTDSPEDVIKYIEKAEDRINAYFIDVDLSSSINGMDIAKKIREADSRSYIVFITGHYELSMMTFEYKIRALDYILKGDYDRIKDRLNDCMAVIMNENLKEDNDKIFIAKAGTKFYKIPYKDILFFETLSGNHKILLHTTDGFIEFYGTLRDIIEQLNDDFYQCHKSYVVNIKNIKEINKEEQFLEMTNNEKCYYSKRYKKGLLAKCLLK